MNPPKMRFSAPVRSRFSAPALFLFGLLFAALAPVSARAQLAPEIGYLYPAGGRAGTTIEVVLGSYDGTPDMQVFALAGGIKLELIGPPSEVLVPAPPYWFGAKGRGPAWPLPREFPARLTIPADAPDGLVRLQVANANGASPPGSFGVGNFPEVMEDAGHKTPQLLEQLPIVVNGQIRLIEEIDRYEFIAPRNGPITLEILARQLGSPLHALLKVQDEEGQTVLDAADTEGRDLAETFIARAGVKYTVSLHDLDFAGDRSYVYRLSISPGSRVLAAYPAGGKRGTTSKHEFLGWGIATGAHQIESVSRQVAIPAANGGPLADSFSYVLETPAGPARPISLALSDMPELAEAAGAKQTSLAELPCAITGAIETRFGSDSYTATFTKGESWRIATQAAVLGSPLDLELTILGPDGKEAATNDDSPGSTDPLILFTAPADGVYTLVVTDRSGKSGTRAANYRLVVERPRDDFSLLLPTQLAVPLAGAAKLAVKVARTGNLQGPIQLFLASLPDGVTAPAELVIPEGKNELSIDLACAPEAAATAALATVSATCQAGEQTISRTANVLLAVSLKPRVKITPEGLDDVRKIQRGSTFLAPLLIERLEGYSGEIVLEMTAKQQRHRQGLASGEFVVPPGANRVEYPIFVPEWMETTKTSRMIVNGVVRVPDPKGNVRTLVQRQELRIGILPEGALMKLSRAAGSSGEELELAPGGELRVALALFRAPEFRAPARIELVAPDLAAGSMTAEPLLLAPHETGGTIVVKLSADARLAGEQALLFRAAAQKDGKWPVLSETTVPVLIKIK